MNTRAKFTTEIFLFLLALLLGLALRLYHLGAAPLSDEEAGWALQAFYIANPALTPENFSLGPQPGYIFLTAMLFSLFGSSEFLARLWPVLAGALLPLLPLALRRELGRPAAILLAFGLALDPGLTTVSRQAGGPMMALGFGLLALALWKTRRPLAAGIAAGLAALSGPAILTGAIPLALAALAARTLASAAASRPATQVKELPAEIGAWAEDTTPQEEIPDSTPPMENAPEGATLRQDAAVLLAAAGMTILLVGTSFLRHPEGLSAWASTLSTYLSGWVNSGGVPALRLPAALLVFQPLGLAFACISLARWIWLRSPGENGSQQDRSQAGAAGFFAMWMTLSLVFSLLYPARQVSDLIWVLVPIWALASLELAHYLPGKRIDWISLLLAGMLFILAALFWNTLIASNRIQPVEQVSYTVLRYALLAGILVLGGLLIALVGLGWSWKSSQLGTVWGISAALLVYGVGVLWSAAMLNPNQPQELWARPPATGQAGLMMATVHDLAARNAGLPAFGEIYSTIDIPSMRWMLRSLPEARFVANIPQEQMPQMVITAADMQSPELAAAYRGQDFAWWVNPGWEGVLPPNLVEWLTFRTAPITYGKIILWVRSDLFPGASSSQP